MAQARWYVEPVCRHIWSLASCLLVMFLGIHSDYSSLVISRSSCRDIESQGWGLCLDLKTQVSRSWFWSHDLLSGFLDASSDYAIAQRTWRSQMVSKCVLCSGNISAPFVITADLHLLFVCHFPRTQATLHCCANGLTYCLPACLHLNGCLLVEPRLAIHPHFFTFVLLWIRIWG